MLTQMKTNKKNQTRPTAPEFMNKQSSEAESKQISTARKIQSSVSEKTQSSAPDSSQSSASEKRQSPASGNSRNSVAGKRQSTANGNRQILASEKRQSSVPHKSQSSTSEKRQSSATGNSQNSVAEKKPWKKPVSARRKQGRKNPEYHLEIAQPILAQNDMIDQVEAVLIKMKQQAAKNESDLFTLIKPRRQNDFSQVLSEMAFKKLLSSGKIYKENRRRSSALLFYTITSALFDDGYFVEFDQDDLKVSETQVVKYMEMLVRKPSNLNYYWRIKNRYKKHPAEKEKNLNKFPIIGIISRQRNNHNF
jgi:hypothetical protein